MISVAIPGGSRKEILAVVKQAKAIYKDDVKFLVFDEEQNIDVNDLWEYRPCTSEEDSVKNAVQSIVDGHAQVLMKGMVQTRTMLKEVLVKENGLRDKSVLSHVALVNLPQYERNILLTDAAMNIAPTTEQLIQIVENAIQVAHRTGISQPKIALLSSAEKYNPKMPSSVLAKEVMDHFTDRNDAIIYGPISLDLAISKEAAEHKRFDAPIKGDADILVVPTIDVGNTLYKAFTIIGDAVIGGVIVGAKIPIVLTSRSDDNESKLFALDFAIQQVR